MSKIARDRRVKLELTQTRDGLTKLVVDVEALDEDMPHEHRGDLKGALEETLGMPAAKLQELMPGLEITVRKKGSAVRAHTHGPGDAEHTHGSEGDHVHVPAAALAGNS